MSDTRLTKEQILDLLGSESYKKFQELTNINEWFAGIAPEVGAFTQALENRQDGEEVNPEDYIKDEALLTMVKSILQSPETAVIQMYLTVENIKNAMELNNIIVGAALELKSRDFKENLLRVKKNIEKLIRGKKRI